MAAQVPSPPTGLDDPTQRRYRGSGKITDYEVTNAKLGEGTFGVVSKARSRRTGAIVALKKILMHNEKDGFPITALREVKLLKMLSHPNILRLEEMAVERTDEKGVGSKMGKKRATLYMVTPYMDHDLSGMLTNPDIQLKEAQIKCYMLQLLEGLRYLHDSHILHRDMKAANILISNRGLLQIADFGLARHYEGPTPRAGQGNGEAVRDYTSLVVTRWYRPPELLLTLKRYTPAIDMWGVGCVFGEMFERKPILEGRTDIDQCHRIFALVGSPTDQTMPGWKELQGCEGTNTWESKKGDIDQRFGRWLKPEGLNLLKSLLCLDWRRRVNAIDALQHEYFKTAPLPLRPEDLPRYEDSHELDARRRGHEQKRALPPAPQGGTVGMGPDEWTGSGPGYPVNGYGYDSRPPPRGYGRDRGPPGAPQPRGYDDRRGPPAPPDAGRREPAWRRDARPPPINGHALPPRPDTSLPPRPNGPLPDRGPPPAARDGRDARPRAGGGGADIDTYIPNYSDRPPPPREREGHRDAPPDRYDRGRRGSRDNAYRDDDVPPPRAVYRDPDAPGRGPDPYRDRDRNGGPGAAYAEQRRTRSRSPAGRMRNDDDRRESDFTIMGQLSKHNEAQAEENSDGTVDTSLIIDCISWKAAAKRLIRGINKEIQAEMAAFNSHFKPSKTFAFGGHEARQDDVPASNAVENRKHSPVNETAFSSIAAPTVALPSSEHRSDSDATTGNNSRHRAIRRCDACRNRYTCVDGDGKPCERCRARGLMCTYNSVPAREGEEGSRMMLLLQIEESQRKQAAARASNMRHHEEAQGAAANDTTRGRGGPLSDTLESGIMSMEAAMDSPLASTGASSTMNSPSKSVAATSTSPPKGGQLMESKIAPNRAGIPKGYKQSLYVQQCRCLETQPCRCGLRDKACESSAKKYPTYGPGSRGGPPRNQPSMPDPRQQSSQNQTVTQSHAPVFQDSRPEPLLPAHLYRALRNADARNLPRRQNLVPTRSGGIISIEALASYHRNNLPWWRDADGVKWWKGPWSL